MITAGPRVADLILITGDASPARIEQLTRAALSVDAPGRLAVQLRAWHLSSDERERLGTALRAITRERGAQLLVNRDLELAMRLEADGLQVPEGGPAPSRLRERWGERLLREPSGEPLIGVSCHDARGLEAAAEAGADFALLSPVGVVEGKNAPLGVSGFASLAGGARLPVHALGGVDEHNAAALLASGASGVAVIRAVYAAPDPAQAVQALLGAIDAGRAQAQELT